MHPKRVHKAAAELGMALPSFRHPSSFSNPAVPGPQQPRELFPARPTTQQQAFNQGVFGALSPPRMCSTTPSSSTSKLLRLRPHFLLLPTSGKKMSVWSVSLYAPNACHGCLARSTLSATSASVRTPWERTQNSTEVGNAETLRRKCARRRCKCGDRGKRLKREQSRCTACGERQKPRSQWHEARRYRCE
jgi:hypothetical protein